MAACRRVPRLLLLMSIFLYVHPIREDKYQINGVAKPPVSVVIPAQNPGGAPAAVNGAPVLAALPLRRRTSGWKLAEEGACREDLTRLCPKHSWNNNLAVLECLQDRKEVWWSERYCVQSLGVGFTQAITLSLAIRC